MTSATASVAVYTIEPATDDRHARPYRCGPAAPSRLPHPTAREAGERLSTITALAVLSPKTAPTASAWVRP